MDERDLTCDEFLGGRVRAWQPRRGYRAATDPVLLAAACPAQTGQTVLELGCGVGVASLCLAARVADLEVFGVERQAPYADLARRNGLDVFTADLANLPDALRKRSFHHVISNPPFLVEDMGTPADDPGREHAFRAQTPLSSWCGAARARLAPKGWLTMIHRTDRLPDILQELDGFGAVCVRPLAPRVGREAKRIILRAQKGARGPFRLLAPLVLHEGDSHQRDGDDFAPLARAILRDGAPMPFE